LHPLPVSASKSPIQGNTAAQENQEESVQLKTYPNHEPPICIFLLGQFYFDVKPSRDEIDNGSEEMPYIAQNAAEDEKQQTAM
jgi:hypothetical protein